ncbi:MAG: 6,7-dimethyl-8-ribityllumazine synthase [Planctomycetaceae bacterium]|nr:6,7-dimethyl-8-ribityllumazine synthase [Planctomycetaceae bacterium]
MPNVYEGELKAVPGKWAIVVSRYNEHLTGRLLEGAVKTLVEAGAADDEIDVFFVPGAFELPTIAAAAVARREYNAVLCLGAVIRGETTHDQHINRAVSMALAELGVTEGIPVLFGVLTCDTLEQALNRAGGNVGNKGAECAEAALRMAHLLGQMDESP